MMIEVKNLWKSFNGNTVLKGLNLSVEAGETLVILGRSGCGKSVLLRHILGLEKPDKGEVIVGGRRISELREGELYKAIHEMGMLFQASALFDSLTVGENTAFYLNQHNRHTKEEVEKLVAEALAMVGLEGKQNVMPGDLSGGMRKRAALARLIVYRPKILLYDEPTTGLDPITAMQINELIVKTQQELNATSIVVTHDICSAFYVADRIALNHEGKIVYLASKEEFIKIDDPIVQTFLKNAIPTGIG
jgi:phospholipid/cholesterol/gamma-HCH transport system ATP-binding protein